MCVRGLSISLSQDLTSGSGSGFLLKGYMDSLNGTVEKKLIERSCWFFIDTGY